LNVIFNFNLPARSRPMNPFRSVPLTVAAALFAAAPLAAAPAEDGKPLADSDRISELERKVKLLTDELARTRQDIAVPEEKESLESVHGLGPGASKIYGIAHGLSIGGYAEAFYSAVVADKRQSGEHDRADLARAVIYAGYKFTDHILFNTEIEFEHATTEKTATTANGTTEDEEGGTVSVEFAALDFLIRDEVNARAGLMLLPVGFLNQIHEPPFYYGTHRPDTELLILPSTWRELGAGIFGRIADQLSYKLYVVTSMNAVGFRPSGIRDGRQQGSDARAEDLAFVGRLDWQLVPELMVGASAFVGNTGQNQAFDTNGDGQNDVRLPDALLTLWDAHAEFTSHGLRARGLFAMSHLRDAGSLTRDLLAAGRLGAGQAVAQDTLGGYGEIGYEVLQWIAPTSGWTVEPFVRAEYIDTQYDMPSGFRPDRTQQFQEYTVGVSAKPIPNVVLKFDYRDRVARKGELGDEINLGIGVVF
jgi:hypothetical protein